MPLHREDLPVQRPRSLDRRHMEGESKVRRPPTDREELVLSEAAVRMMRVEVCERIEEGRFLSNDEVFCDSNDFLPSPRRVRKMMQQPDPMNDLEALIRERERVDVAPHIRFRLCLRTRREDARPDIEIHIPMRIRSASEVQDHDSSFFGGGKMRLTISTRANTIPVITSKGLTITQNCGGSSLRGGGSAMSTGSTSTEPMRIMTKSAIPNEIASPAFGHLIG